MTIEEFAAKWGTDGGSIVIRNASNEFRPGQPHVSPKMAELLNELANDLQEALANMKKETKARRK